MPSNSINDLFVDANNNLWLVCNGITKFTGTSFINYMTDPNPSQGYTVYALYVANNIVYAVGNGIGLIKYNTSNNTFTQYTTANSNIPGLKFGTLDMDQNGRLWMGSFATFQGGYAGGIAIFDGNTFTSMQPYPITATWVYYNQSIAIDQSQNVWLSGRCGGLYKYDGLSWTHMGANLPQNGCAGFVFADQHNRIWYGDVYSGLWTSTPFLGVNEHATTNTISLYPNPVNSILTITVNDPAPIKVFNVLGQIQLEKYFESNSNGRIELDVSSLSSGMYFIKIEGEVKKFIKE